MCYVIDMSEQDLTSFESINASNHKHALALAGETGNFTVEQYKHNLVRDLRGDEAKRDFYCEGNLCPLRAEFNVYGHCLCSIHAVQEMLDAILEEEA